MNLTLDYFISVGNLSSQERNQLFYFFYIRKIKIKNKKNPTQLPKRKYKVFLPRMSSWAKLSSGEVIGTSLSSK